MTLLRQYVDAAQSLGVTRVSGRVEGVRGLTLRARNLPLPVGAMVKIHGASGSAHALGEVVGFDDSQSIIMLLTGSEGVTSGDVATGVAAGWSAGTGRQIGASASCRRFPVGRSLLGRCVNALGEPIDGRGRVAVTVARDIEPGPQGSMLRSPISERLETGVRAIDLMTTMGRGQRMGIFAGPGVGKSTLLGAIARNTSARVNVIALIGERGREVREFVEHTLGEEGLSRSVVVVATSDESPLMRIRAALAACTIAEYFRDDESDLGGDVLLMMDSVTRFAHAQRQVGLSAGEPPATRGYTPSVFALLARLLERAGSLTGSNGSVRTITGLYSILVEGDDMTEPVADAVRGILDGHIMLSRPLARQGHYPAIDVLDSVSRLADAVCDSEHRDARRRILRHLAAYARNEDLIQIGAYAKGSSEETDVAIALRPRMLDILRQGLGATEREPFAKSREALISLAAEAARLGKGKRKG